MSNLLENHLPVVMSDGINTLKPATFGGVTQFTGPLLSLPSAFTTAQTLTSTQSGNLIGWNAAAGFTYTLPAPTVGLNYSFFVQTSVTSSNHKLITNSASVFLLGGLQMGEVAATTAPAFAADGTTIRAVTMNGTTTGGLIGTFFNVYCISATQWVIEGLVLGSGTLATPFTTS